MKHGRQGGSLKSVRVSIWIPQTAVTVASLITAAQEGLIDPRRDVMLNITGGGYKRVQEEFDLIPVTAALATDNTTPPGQIARFVNTWVKDHA